MPLPLVGKIYPICVMTRCAETGRVPPASGVIVSAVELPAGFLTVRTELITVLIVIKIPSAQLYSLPEKLCAI